MSIQLLPHNQEAYNKVTAALRTSQRTCVVQPTGTGKSYIIAAVAENYKRVLVLAPNYFVLGQVESVMQRKEGQTVELMTYMGLSVARSINGGYDLIVLDEFHRAGAQEWGEAVNGLLEINPQAKVLGTTATPVRYLDAGRNMADELFGGNVASQMTIGEAWAKGILPVPVYVTGLYDFEKSTTEVANTLSRAQNISKEERRKRLEQLRLTMLNWKESHGMVSILRKYIDSDIKRMLVFCDHIGGMSQMVRTVTGWFEQAGIAVGDTYRLHSGLSDKALERRMSNFESDTQTRKGIKLMFSVNMLNEGVHIPHVEAVLMLRSTRSRIIYMQQIGRCLSASNGNRKPVVLDMADNISNTSSVQTVREEFIRWQEKNRKRKNTEREGIAFEIHDHLQDLRNIVEHLSGDVRITIPYDERIAMLHQYCAKHGQLPASRHKEDFRNWAVLRTHYADRPEVVQAIKDYPRFDKRRTIERMAQRIKDFCDEHDRAPLYYGDTPTERRLGQAWKDRRKYLVTVDGMQEYYDRYSKSGTLARHMAVIRAFCKENNRIPGKKGDGDVYQKWVYVRSVRKQHPEINAEFLRLRDEYGKRPVRTLDEAFDYWERYAQEHDGLPKGSSRKNPDAKKWSAFMYAHKAHPRTVALMEKYGKA